MRFTVTSVFTSIIAKPAAKGFAAATILCAASVPLGSQLEGATTDKYLTGWWHTVDIGYAVGDTPVNYRPPKRVDNGSSIEEHFDSSLSIRYSLQQHDMVRPGFWGGAYWGVGCNVVYQTMSDGYKGNPNATVPGDPFPTQQPSSGALDATSLMVIPQVQLGLSFRYGKRWMLQAGGFLGFGIGLTDYDVESNLPGGTVSSTSHTALAFEQGAELRLRYSTSRKMHFSLGFMHSRREVAHSRETWDLGTGSAVRRSNGDIQERRTLRYNTDIEQDLYLITAGMGLRF